VTFSRQPTPSTDYYKSKTNKKRGIFQVFAYHDNKLFRLTREIKSRIAMVKAPFKKNIFFYQQIEIKLEEANSKVLHLEHSFIWS